jgi:AcrR family transcriptional regulator
MPRPRFDNLDPDRREQILAAAADEFATRGYSAASLNRIIEEAGISKGSLYYYFDDKTDLLATVVRTAFERMLGEAAGFDPELLTAEDYWEALREIGLQSLELLHRDDWCSRLALGFPRLRTEPEAAEAVADALEFGRNLATRLLARGQAIGVVRTDLPLDLLVATTMAMDEAGDRWLAERYATLDRDELRRLTEARVDLLRDMLDAAHEGWGR